MSQKIGLGYDVHRLVQDRKLVLGGVEVPHDKGLKGHSDADVLVHAVCDAVLGALGKGDIGEHFPDTDNQYKDISSLVLLEKVHNLLQKDGYTVVNVDATIIAEEPKLEAYKPKMKFNIAYRLSIDESSVNIKATTQEGLGFVGQKEGMAAYAIVLLNKED